MKREKAEQVIKSLEDFFEKKYGERLEFPLFDHDHLELNPGSWSTYNEGWYDGDRDMYWTGVVINAVAEGKIKLPEGVGVEVYGVAELYFYEV